MAAKDRIYRVTQKVSGGDSITRLVRAQNVQQAENFVASDTITAEIATQDDLLELGATCKVEVARPRNAELPL